MLQVLQIYWKQLQTEACQIVRLQPSAKLATLLTRTVLSLTSMNLTSSPAVAVQNDSKIALQVSSYAWQGQGQT